MFKYNNNGDYRILFKHGLIRLVKHGQNMIIKDSQTWSLIWSL